MHEGGDGGGDIGTRDATRRPHVPAALVAIFGTPLGLRWRFLVGKGQVTTLPCTEIFPMEGYRIKDLPIYTAPSPLFA